MFLLQLPPTLAPLVDTGSDVAPSLELFSEKSFPFGFLSFWFTLSIIIKEYIKQKLQVNSKLV